MKIYDVISSIEFKNNSTVVFDIDGTLITNSGNGIKVTLDIYNYFLSKGIRPYIVTARVNERNIINITQSQLEKAGITGYSGIYFRPYYMNIREFKERSREDITYKRNAKIEMTFGDKNWDYTGKYSGIGVKISKLKI